MKFMKKWISLMLPIALILSMSTVAFAAEETDGTAVVRTWTNDAGEKVTGIITMGSDVLAACVNPTEENQARGFITGSRTECIITPYAYDEYQVSDYIYMRIFNDKNQAISVYKVTMTGMVSRVGAQSYITSITFSRISGDVCSTHYGINGCNATAMIIHPIEGYLDAHITLGSGGSFAIY